MAWPVDISSNLALAVIGIQIILLLIASWADLSTRLIPDRACLAIGVAGAVMRLSIGPLAVAESVAVAAVLFLVLLLAHARGLLGGGDVKLLVAVVVGQSFTGAMQVLFITALAGGVLALAHLVLRRLPRPLLAPAGACALRRVYVAERWRILRHAPLPYGMAIACGGAWTLLAQQGI